MSNVIDFRPAWRDRLQMSATGAVKNNLFNACCAVRGIRGTCGAFYWDEFRQDAVLDCDAPWGASAGQAWTEQDDIRLTEHLQSIGVPVSLEHVRLAVDSISREHCRHDLRTWLTGLQWDGARRIHDWLTYYLGVERTPYVQAVGKAWLISAVARVMRPGCKADHMLILDGTQGIGKSSALRALAGDAYFTDEVADFGSKDAAMQMSGAWIVEISELAGFGTAALERIKGFVTRQVDRYRPPYGKRLVERPRQCVFAGTSNHTEFRDTTGNRRFWPVAVGSVDLDGIRAERDQLWAEAVAEYTAGSPWWLRDRDVIAAAEDEQSSRMQSDPWETVIADWLHVLVDTSVQEVLSGAIKLSTDRWTRRDEMRVAACLKRLGWDRYRRRVNGILVWRYRKNT